MQRIRDKISQVRQRYQSNFAMTQRLNNADVIERALDFLIERDCDRPDIPPSDGNHRYFMCTDSAFSQLLDSVNQHQAMCHSRLEFRPDQILLCGVVASFKFYCDAGHSLAWSSSVYLSNGTFLANARWMYSCFSSG